MNAEYFGLLAATLVGMIWWSGLGVALESWPKSHPVRSPRPILSWWMPILAGFLVYLSIAMVMVWVLELNGRLEAVRNGAKPATAEIFLATAGGHSLFLILFPAFLWIGSGIRPFDLGIHGYRLGQNLLFGLLQAMRWAPMAFLFLVWASQIVTVVPQKEPEQVIMDWHRGETGIPLVALFLFVVIVTAPLTEELLFRGLLQRWVRQSLSADWAIAISAILFGFSHWDAWPHPLALILLGLGFGETFERTRSLWSCVAMHAAFNGVMAGMMLLPGMGR